MAWIKHKDIFYNLNAFYTIECDDKNKSISFTQDDYNLINIFCKKKEEYQILKEKIDMAIFGQINALDY